MINFEALWMAGGFIAIGIPLLIHFLHRKRIRHTTFSAMQFLSDVLMQQQQRMRFNNILILVMRIACIFFLIAALCRPQWISQQLASGHIQRQGSCAALILIDDSASSRELMPFMKELTLAYMDTLKNGDEISIYSSSGAINTDPMYDLDAARTIIRTAKSYDTTSDIPQLLDHGLQNIRRHLNPEREIIIVSDGQLSAWHSDDEQRWQQLQTQCAQLHIRLIHLLAPRETTQNISLSHIYLKNHLFSVGQKNDVSIHIQSNESVIAVDTLLRVRKDGRIIDERIIHCNANEQQIISIPVQFNDAGSHHIDAELHGLHDAIQADNRRGISIVVNDHIPVLLVDSFAGEQSYYLKQALLSRSGEHSIFHVEHSDLAALHHKDLNAYKVIILTDIPALDHRHIAHLERYIVSGGSVLVSLGPHSDPDSMNTYWVRNGDGFLPAYVKKIRHAQAAWFDVVSRSQQHPALLSLPITDSVPFNSSFNSYYILHNDTFESADDSASVLMEFANGDPFLLERKRGEGRVLLCASSFDMQWGTLPQNPLFVPWIRGLCSYMASFLLPPRTIECGQSIAHPTPDVRSWRITDELHNTISSQLDRTQGRHILRSETITRAGVYSAHTDDAITYYVANINEQEYDAHSISTDLFQHMLTSSDTEHNNPIHMFHSVQDIIQAWNAQRGQDLAIWRYFIGACLLCLLIEASITHQVVMRERRLNASGADGEQR